MGECGIKKDMIFLLEPERRGLFVNFISREIRGKIVKAGLTLTALTCLSVLLAFVIKRGTTTELSEIIIYAIASWFAVFILIPLWNGTLVRLLTMPWPAYMFRASCLFFECFGYVGFIVNLIMAAVMPWANLME